VRLRSYRAATITNAELPVFSICHAYVQFQFMNSNLVEAWAYSYQVRSVLAKKPQLRDVLSAVGHLSIAGVA
jgi:hypothetical protein